MFGYQPLEGGLTAQAWKKRRYIKEAVEISDNEQLYNM